MTTSGLERLMFFTAGKGLSRRWIVHELPESNSQFHLPTDASVEEREIFRKHRAEVYCYLVRGLSLKEYQSRCKDKHQRRDRNVALDAFGVNTPTRGLISLREAYRSLPTFNTQSFLGLVNYVRLVSAFFEPALEFERSRRIWKLKAWHRRKRVLETMVDTLLVSPLPRKKPPDKSMDIVFFGAAKFKAKGAVPVVVLRKVVELVTRKRGLYFTQVDEFQYQ